MKVALPKSTPGGDGEPGIDIPDDKPVTITKRLEFDDNKSSYDFLADMKKYGLTVSVASVLVDSVTDRNNYIDLSSAGNDWNYQLCQ